MQVPCSCLAMSPVSVYRTVSIRLTVAVLQRCTRSTWRTLVHAVCRRRCNDSAGCVGKSRGSSATWTLHCVASYFVCWTDTLRVRTTRNLADANRSRVSKICQDPYFLLHLKRAAALLCEKLNIYQNNKTLKWPSKVTQGHRKCHGSIKRIWLPITVP